MTTKYKIIGGFTFMMLLLAGMAIFANLRLGGIADGFVSYRSEARTAVSGNAADALIREAKDCISNFMQTLDPAFMDKARTALAGSIGYIDEAVKVEPSAELREQLERESAGIKNLSGQTQTVQDGLIGAHKVVEGPIVAAAASIDQTLSALNVAARASGNNRILELVDDAYTNFTNIRVMLRVYNASYQADDGEKAADMLSKFEAVVKGLSSAAMTSEEMKLAGTFADGFAQYRQGFADMDGHIKTAVEARAKMGEEAVELARFFDKYTADAQATMNQLGAALQSNSDNAQSLLLVSGVAGVIIGLLFAAWISLSVVRVLNRVSTFAGEMAKGNLEADLNVREGGEIGNVIAAMDSMSASSAPDSPRVMAP